MNMGSTNIIIMT